MLDLNIDVVRFVGKIYRRLVELCYIQSMRSSHSNIDVKTHILVTARKIMGRKGFTAVGLNEILAEANVPKGSFYYYFHSKEAFGEVLLTAYFSDYLDEIDATLKAPGKPAAERFMRFWEHWLETQAGNTAENCCLVVKLGAEVCDLSEAMRRSLDQGTRQVVERLADCIAEGVADGSLPKELRPFDVAQMLYQLWLGATLLAKTSRSRRPLESAMATTRQIFKLGK